MSDQNIPCVVVTRPDTHGKMHCVYRMTAFSASDEFDGAEDGDSLVLTLKTMTQEELDALPDFSGW